MLSVAQSASASVSKPRGGRPRKSWNPIRTMNGKFLITEKNLFNRIQTRLACQGERLRISLTNGEKEDLGRFYIIRHNGIPGGLTKELIVKDVKLEDLGRELGVLRPNEILAPSDGGEEVAQ